MLDIREPIVDLPEANVLAWLGRRQIGELTRGRQRQREVLSACPVIAAVNDFDLQRLRGGLFARSLCRFANSPVTLLGA